MEHCLSKLSKREIGDIIAKISDKKYVPAQIYKWINKKNARSFEEMTDVSKQIRETLSESYCLTKMETLKKVKSSDGTAKYLFRLHDGNAVESVLMKYSYGYAACVSTQCGCEMGCTFCASATGFIRNLSFDEIAAQIYAMNADEGVKIGNVVLMGSGEPLLNYGNCLKFIELINDESGQNISQRNITVSTCGIIPAINKLSTALINGKKPQLTLAVSLHAPNDDVRKQLMPIADKYKIADLIKACDNYSNLTKRRVTYEYALIKGVNDSIESAKELALKIKGTLCHVNLIPVNPMENETEKLYRRPSQDVIQKFQGVLKSSGIEVTIRRELGSDINAACGQLRNEKN